jgi:hypothetical protein
MTDYQFEYIKWTVVIWSSIIIANLSTNPWIIGWFLICASWGIAMQFILDCKKN